MMLDETHLAFLVAIVTGVVWAVRVEAKANRSDEDLALLRESFEAHEADKAIHHNADAFIEFEKRIDLRFAHLAESVEKVEKYVEDIDKKIERYLNEQ